MDREVSMKMPFHHRADQTGVLSTLQIVSSVSIGTSPGTVRLYAGLSAYALPIAQVALPRSPTYCRLPTNCKVKSTDDRLHEKATMLVGVHEKAARWQDWN